MPVFVRHSSFVTRHSARLRGPLRRGEGGFTLVELMVVITLIGFASAIVTVSWSRSIAARRVESAAWMVGTMLKRARILAVQTGMPHRMRLDGKEGRCWIERRAGTGDPEPFEALSAGLGDVQELGWRVSVEELSETGDLPAFRFDARGRLAHPARIVLANPYHDDWTIAMTPSAGRTWVGPGRQDPWSPLARPDLSPDGLASNLPPMFAAAPQ